MFQVSRETGGERLSATHLERLHDEQRGAGDTLEIREIRGISDVLKEGRGDRPIVKESVLLVHAADRGLESSSILSRFIHGIRYGLTAQNAGSEDRVNRAFNVAADF
jgi:hypothetical protein